MWETNKKVIKKNFYRIFENEIIQNKNNNLPFKDP